MKQPLNILEADLDGKIRYFLCIGELDLSHDVPGHRIAGELKYTDAGDPKWSTIQPNPVFLEAYTRFMRGEFSEKPAILDQARVEPGGWIYVIDNRGPQSDTPEKHNIIGAYKADDDGKPVAESFHYNDVSHELVLSDGTQSTLFEEAFLKVVESGEIEEEEENEFEEEDEG